MSEHVWVTDFMGDPSLMLMYQTDLSERDFDASVEGIQALERGLPVPADRRPACVFPVRKSKKRSVLPPLFCTNGFWVVSKPVAEIMSDFDLGGGGVFPVTVMGAGNQTPIAGQWFCWIYGNLRDTLDAEASVNLRMYSLVPGEDRRSLATHPADGDAAVSKQALVSPDVWIEKRLKRTVLLSGALGDALVAAGFQKALRMTRARVV